MKKIPLSGGGYCLVDAEDFGLISRYSWHDSGYGYAKGMVNGKKVFMHRLINKTPKGLETDHINGNRLDNRRQNLRALTRSENQQHRTRLNKNNKSGFPGIWWDKSRGKWVAEIWRNSEKIRLGRFELKENAILARLEFING